MAESLYLSVALDAIVLPLLGIVATVLPKIGQGEFARLAERQFFVALVIMTLITLRTVINCDDVWLVHTLTLSIMIVGSLVVPNQKPSVAV